MSRPSAAEQARRLLAVLHLLEAGASVPLQEVADKLGMTAEELEADLEMLSCCGVAPYTPEALLPVFVEDREIVVWGKLPALDQPVRLSRSEAHALVTALGAAGFAEDDTLVAKLLAASVAQDDGEVAARLAGAGASPGSEALKQLTHALEHHLLVEMAYFSASSGGTSDRLVEPVSLVNERGAWYLEAFCRSAGALRTFRVDRIRSLEVLGEAFDPRELTARGRALVTAGLPVARIRLAPGEDFSEREWPGARMVGTHTDGSTLVEMPFAGTAWIARQVVARLGRAEVLEPDEVRRAVAGLAAEVLAV